LHVLPFFSCGGTELVVRRLIASLDTLEFQQNVCVMRGFDAALASATQCEDRIFQAGDSCERFQFPLLRLMRIMRRLRPHVVHTRNWGALEAVLAARLAGVPATVHSEHGYDMDTISGLPLRRRVIRRHMYALTDVLFTVSNELREFHARQASIPADRIRVLYNGVDAERFAFRSQARAETRARLGIRSESVVVGSVGRLVPIKDYPLTFRGISQLIQRGHDIVFLLVGGGPELDTLEQLVRDSSELNGRVHFLGFSDRIPELLSAMDIFVQTSRAEGMSNTLLEAMATSLPLLATRVGGNSEIIVHGETGYLFPPGDCATLIRHLNSLVSSTALRWQLGQAGRRRTLKEFSIERMLDEYRKLYQGLAAAGGAVSTFAG
jgi:sugar transferase (PEP-CTERM/EpsH1 system associated)